MENSILDRRFSRELHSHTREWNRLARIGDFRVQDAHSLRAELNIIRQYLRGNMKALEIGCGNGDVARTLAPRVKSYLAIDTSYALIEAQLADSQNLRHDNLSFKAQSIDNPTLEAGTFGALICLDTLHFMGDWQAAIARAHELLIPGGVWISSAKCLSEYGSLERLKRRLSGLLRIEPRTYPFSHVDFITATAERFAIDEAWSPDENKSVFLIARKS